MKIFQYISISLFLVLSYDELCGQILLPLDLEVTKNGKVLDHPFVGGMSAPQFSEIDLNGDGIKDLFVFDRNGNVMSTFLNAGTSGVVKYVYAPEYVRHFPSAHTWCMLHDFNGDGIEDVFKAPDALGIAGIEIWRGSKEGGNLHFTKIKNSEFAVDVLTYNINGSITNIYASIVDIPGIYDVDGDGDTDILTFEPDGSYLHSYLNRSMENGFGRDTFIMEFRDQCFGKIIENQFNEQILLSSASNQCASFLGTRKGDRHSGSTITPWDSNCDGRVDLLLGDVSGEYITFLQNGGNATEAWFTSQDNRWPNSDVSLRIQNFPAAYVIDANNDGFKDIIIASNESNNNQNLNNVWLYLHEGTTCGESYKLHTKTFLVDEMLQFGTGSHPAIIDVDKDGLLDIIVGSNGIAQAGAARQNRLFLLKNIGTTTQPAYRLENEDFLELSKLTANYSRLAPSIGDLDGDGDDDIFIGNSNGTLMFYRNDNQKFSLVNTEFQNIFVGPNSSPYIYDFDKDGLLDFIIGESNNSLNFYKNKGSKTNALFDEFSDMLPNSDNVGILFDKNNFATQNGSPEIFVSGNEAYLLMGFNSDSLSLYKIVSPDPSVPFILLKKNVLPNKPGKRLNPSIADINNDGYLEMVVGNERGGLSFYSTNIKIGDPVTKTEDLDVALIQIYPNPASEILNVTGIKNKGSFKVYDNNGKTLVTNTYNADFQINTKYFVSGVYFIALTDNHTTAVKQFIISH